MTTSPIRPPTKSWTNAVVIDAKTFERNASVLGQAMAAGQRAITALKDLQEAGSTIADRIRLHAPDKS